MNLKRRNLLVQYLSIAYGRKIHDLFSLPVLSLDLQACFDSWRNLQQTILPQILQILHDPGLTVPGRTLIVHWMGQD